MTATQLGDLAQSYTLRADNARLKLQMAEITRELSTGQAADLAAHVRADLSPLAGIEHDLTRLEGYATTITESTLMVDTLQNALEKVQTETQDLSAALITVGSTNNPTVAQAAGVTALETFGAMVSTLSLQVGGRSLLSGIDSDTPALASAEDMLADMRTAIAASGANSAAAVRDVVDIWFGPGGGFETMGYTGSTTTLAPVSVGRGIEVQQDLTAADPRIRDILSAVALSALVGDGVLNGIAGEEVALTAIAGERVISAQSGLSTLRAEVGAMQATLERAGQSNGAAQQALELTRYEIMTVDPYDSATRLEAVQIQLESLYALTARLGRMSLVDFLR